jgi:glycosyltransferase involved in cell wall biosynthesis
MNGAEAGGIEISAVIPCLNEEENVVAIADAVTDQLLNVAASHEIIFIDNGSTDRTVELAKQLCANDSRIRLIVNNQNYGQMRSPTHAIYQTRGRAVVGICADFQDPPEMIPQFVERWRAGARIVLAIRQSEKTSLLLRMLRAIGYGFFERFGDYRVIPGATGFGLYDREVIHCLKQWRDPEPFFRGMLVESGFPLETIPYHRPPRAGGVTKNNIATLFSFAVSGLASSSKRLLRAPITISLLVGVAAAVTFLVGVAQAVLGAFSWTFIWLTLAEIAFALVFLFLGLIGEQVRLISAMVRNTPLVVEKERVNFPPSDQ